MRLRLLVLCAALSSCLAASAATITSYTSQSAFAAASSTTTIEGFPLTVGASLGSSYTKGGISFSTNATYYVYNDVSGYHNSTAATNAPYLAADIYNGNNTATVAAPSEVLSFAATNAIGFNLGDFFGAETITVLIDGNTFTYNVPATFGSEVFAGFTSTGTFNTVTLTGNNQEIDLIQAYLGTAAPVAVTPEPSSLALLGTGLLGIVGMARKRIA